MNEKISLLEKLLDDRRKYQLLSDAISEFKVLEEILLLNKEIYGEKSDEYIIFLNEYIGASKYIGKTDIGLKYAKIAKDIIIEKYGNKSVMYATTLLNETEVKRYANILDDLEKNYLEVLSIYDENKMSSNFEYAGLCNNLGLYYQQILNYEEAIKYHEKSLTILSKSLNNKIEYATTLNNLVEPLKKVNQKDKAYEYLKKAIEIYKEKNGVNHSNYASALNNLALLYYDDKDYEKSYEILKKVLNIVKKTFGESSINYINVLENYNHLEEILENNNLLKDNGINVSKKYFRNILLEEIKKIDEKILDDVCIGVFGSGSECLMLDDKLSQDHDFTFIPTILINDEKYDEYKEVINNIILNSKEEFEGIKKNLTEVVLERRGVHKLSEFVEKQIGKMGDLTIKDYLEIPAINFLNLVNGEIFIDKSKRFTNFRDKINYYPEDIRRYFIAKKCFKIYQSGQYNMTRTFKRNDILALNEVIHEFITNVCDLVYLLNKEYTPFYKWKMVKLRKLDLLGSEIYERLVELLEFRIMNCNMIENKIFEICYLIINELKKQIFIKTNSIYISDLIEDILNSIQNENIRSISIYGV